MNIKNQIIYYDFTNLHFSSFYLSGFQENAKLYNYDFIISKKVPELLSDWSMRKGWIDILFSIVLFKVCISKEEYYFCIDTRDSNDSNIGKGYYLPLLEKVKYYFKVNYCLEKIINDSTLLKFTEKIIPISPFFPLKVPLLSYLPKLFPERNTGWSTMDALRRLKYMNTFLSQDQIKKLRNVKKENDIFFVLRFYPEKIHEKDNEFRYQIMKEIKKYKNINAVVGFIVDEKSSHKPNEFILKEYNYKDYLIQLAKSRVAIYVRGLLNCLSFKFLQLIAMGMPIVGQSIINNTANLLTQPYFDEQFSYNSPGDIVGRAFELLNKPDRTRILSASNAHIFDSAFTPQIIILKLLKNYILLEKS